MISVLSLCQFLLSNTLACCSSLKSQISSVQILLPILITDCLSRFDQRLAFCIIIWMKAKQLFDGRDSCLALFGL